MSSFEPKSKPNRSISMQKHLYEPEVGLRRYKRPMWPLYVGGEAAQLRANGRHGREVNAIGGSLKRHPLKDPVGPGRCLGGREVGKLGEQRPALTAWLTAAAEQSA